MKSGKGKAKWAKAKGRDGTLHARRALSAAAKRTLRGSALHKYAGTSKARRVLDSCFRSAPA